MKMPFFPTVFSLLLISSAPLLRADFLGRQVFPADNPWNQDISNQPVDPMSISLLSSIGLSTPLHPDFGTEYKGEPNGIPFDVVSGSQQRVPVSFRYAGESDPGPYPIPGNSDCLIHIDSVL
tara:strand:+ start:77 stop:442 length:366 start_codon:yes stop_codon:yes gene_type:complete